MELSCPPDGPIADETAPKQPEQLDRKVDPHAVFAETVDCIAERLLSSSSPLPENRASLFKDHLTKLESLQKEAWFCHWGMVVSLCVYQQLISHVDISVRQHITRSLGASLAEGALVDDTPLYDLIEAEFQKQGISLKPDMEFIHRELACTTLHSTLVCYIRDIALRMHMARQMGVESTQDVFPDSQPYIARNFFLRFAAVSSALLDILYDVMPWVQSTAIDTPQVGPVTGLGPV